MTKSTTQLMDTTGRAWHTKALDIAAAIGHITGAGIPSVTPDFIGQEYYDTTNKNFYRATDTTASSDWAIIGDAGLSAAEIAVLDGVTAGTATASKALVVDSNADLTGLRNTTQTGTQLIQGITTTNLNATNLTALNAAVTTQSVAALSATSLTALSSVVTTQSITTLNATTQVVGASVVTTQAVTNLNSTSQIVGTGLATTQSVTNSRVGLNPTQGTFSAFGAAAVSQLAAVTTFGGTTASTNVTPFGFKTQTQADAAINAVDQMRLILQRLGFSA